MSEYHKIAKLIIQAEGVEDDPAARDRAIQQRRMRLNKDRDPKIRLEYLRGELRAEKLSYDEIAELQSLVKYISPDDVELLEAAGVPEDITDESKCRICGLADAKCVCGPDRMATVSKLTVPEKHQLQIALDTVKNPDKALLGGPSLEEAKEIVARLKAKRDK